MSHEKLKLTFSQYWLKAYDAKSFNTNILMREGSQEAGTEVETEVIKGSTALKTSFYHIWLLIVKRLTVFSLEISSFSTLITGSWFLLKSSLGPVDYCCLEKHFFLNIAPDEVPVPPI